MPNNTESIKGLITPGERGALEGTVRMPQDFSVMRLLIIKRCLECADPAKAIAELAAPVENNESAKHRTAKANAQHEFYGIKRKLKVDDILLLQASCNRHTLRFLAKSLGGKFLLPISLTPRIKFDADGAWARLYDTRAVKIILQAFSEEGTTDFLRSLFDSAAGAVTDKTGSNLLRSYKETYRNTARRDNTITEAAYKSAGDRALLKFHIRNEVAKAFTHRAVSENQLKIVQRFIAEI